MTLDTGALRLVMVLQESSESVSGCRRGGEGRGGEGRGGEELPSNRTLNSVTVSTLIKVPIQLKCPPRNG